MTTLEAVSIERILAPGERVPGRQVEDLGPLGELEITREHHTAKTKHKAKDKHKPKASAGKGHHKAKRAAVGVGVGATTATSVGATAWLLVTL